MQIAASILRKYEQNERRSQPVSWKTRASAWLLHPLRVN